MESLVTTDWLQRHLDDPDLVVLDCTVYHEIGDDGTVHTTNGRAAWEEGHIPGAGFADLLGDLADTDSPLLYAVPEPEAFCAAMGALGVGDDSRVVVYDATIAAWAARVWWMLRWVGFDRAGVLDGGLRAWVDEDRPLSTEPPTRAPRLLTPAVRPELIADRDEVFAAIGDDAVCLVDTMPAEHYRGEMTMYERTGHVPGARNIPVRELLEGSGRFRPLGELAAMHDGDPSARTITYCGGGIAAAAEAFVLTRLGYRDVAVYASSMQEWAADPANPMVVD